MAGNALVGFDTAGELSEETRDARTAAPRTIIRAVAFSGIGDAAPTVAHVTQRLGPVLHRIFIADVAIAACVCTLAIQTATTRMVFSMARDRVLPFAVPLAKVSPKTRTPILPAAVVGVLAIAVLILNVLQPAIYLALASVCIIMLYIAVVVWGLFMTVNLAWPRATVYNPVGAQHWHLRYFAILFLAGSLAVGAVAYLRQRHENRDVLRSRDPDRTAEAYAG